MKRFLIFFKSKYKVIFSLSIIFSILFPNIILGAVMESGSYKIQSDSINIGGMDSGSSGYNLNDTAGELSSGDSNSQNYYMHAGYQQMQSTYLAISDPSGLALQSMGGLSHNIREGVLTWNVITDNTAGYSMSIASTTTPAMKSAFDSFADYTPAGVNPDYDFNNPSTDSSFGFSPEGTEASPRFLDNGSSCGTGGTNETQGKCWDGLSTTPKVMAGSVSSNQPLGSDVNVRLRAETGEDHIQTSGNYEVNIVVTAVTL